MTLIRGKKVQIGVYLPAEYLEVIDKLAQEEHRSRNWVVNKAIKEYIEYLGYLEDLTPVVKSAKTIEEEDLRLTPKGLQSQHADIPLQHFVIPDVCSIDLQTGEVELYIDDISEAARQFWEAVKRVAGGKE